MLWRRLGLPKCFIVLTTAASLGALIVIYNLSSDPIAKRNSGGLRAFGLSADGKTETPLQRKSPSVNSNRHVETNLVHEIMNTESKIMNDMTDERPLCKFVLRPWRLEKDNFRQEEVRWVAITMVKSAIHYLDRRSAIRETWSSSRSHDGVRMWIVFILGTTQDRQLQQKVEEEHETFGDILQIDFSDTHEYVPDKTLAGMQYVSEKIPGDWLYSSADDDMALHVVNFVRFIDNTLSASKQPTDPHFSKKYLESLPIMCIYSYSVRDTPARNPKSKWYMSKQDYPPSYWPPYCRGGFYTMPVATVARLHKISRLMPHLHLDDVWITGLMRIKYLAAQNNESSNSLLKEMIAPAPLSERSDQQLIHNEGEDDISKVIVSHVWGDIKGRKVDVAQEIKDVWTKWTTIRNDNTTFAP